ncbi:MAG: MFS transporter [Gorillibacterium sp.]|nr:MFS transporter [Gorillibacterium sp.]
MSKHIERTGVDHDDRRLFGIGQRSKDSRKSRPPLSSQSKLLLLVHTLFIVAGALSGTFVQIYLWKERNDLGMIGWFAVIQQIFMALTFWVAGKWAKEGNKMNVLRAGFIMAVVFYLLVLMLGKEAFHYYLLLGCVQGLMAGFFWLAFNVVYFEVTGPEDRDRFNGWSGLLTSFSGMLAPWLSGIIITNMLGTGGYRIIFTLSVIVFAAGFVCSFFLKMRKPEGCYEWAFGYRLLKRVDRNWRRLLPGMIAQGMREGVFAFIITLLVYISTKNELSIGKYALITSGVSLFSFYVVGHLLKHHHRKWAMLIGVLAMALVILPFFWQIDYRTLLIFGVGTSLFIPLYFIPVTSVVFDLIGKEPDGAEKRVEYVVVREMGINFGRILGTLTFVVTVSLTNSPFALTLLLFLIGLSPLFVWLLLLPWLPSRQTEKSSSG